MKRALFFIMLFLNPNIPGFSEEAKLFITIESNREFMLNEDNIIFKVYIKNITNNEYKLLVSRKFSGNFVEKSISTHGLNNITEYPQTLQFR
jgi:hypothetical protein